MARVTKTFVDNETVIMAADMNGIVADINDLEGAMTTATGTIANKVDKETGKGLSTNDYTTAEKNKLAGLESTYATKADVSSGIAAATTAVEAEIDDLKSGYDEELLSVGYNLEFDNENNLLYLVNEQGERISDGIAIISHGGGGGSSITYTVKLTNLMDGRDFSVAQGASMMLSFEYTSVDDEGFDDGPGVGTISINGAKMRSVTVAQGANNLNITDLLSVGSNAITIRVANSEGMSKSIRYNVNVVSLSLSTTFSRLANYRGDVSYSYTVVGSGTKTVHFVMDGVQIGADTVTTSGRSQTFTITAPAYGGHTFECYATMVVDGVTVTSNTLRHAMLWISDDAMTPAIASTFRQVSAVQGETLEVPYIVYDPLQETTQVTLSVLNPDDTVYKATTISIDRLSQTWYVDDYPAGNIKIQIGCGTTTLSFPLSVTEYVLPVQPVTDSLVLEFSADGRSNGEADPAQWSYNDIEASFGGFGWTGADGWVSDEQGASVLRFLPGDTMTIPFKPFASDARETGYTIEVEMATRDVRDYESVVLSCLNSGRGFQIASQEARLSSEQSGISMLFKEDSRVRVAFSIENRNQNRLVYIYINGIMCGVTQYPTNDNFQQPSPVGITIGAESCGLDLYKIRCYTKGLTRAEQLDNFIVDRSSLAERVDAVERNDILDESDEVVINKLPDSLPYMILRCPQLPQYKGDKKPGVEVTFTDPLAPARCWTASGVEMDVQGTSSAGYPVKNYKIKLKSGITWTASGEEASGFPIHEGELPTKTICFKADFASSENANNVVLAKFYNDIVPYQTEPQQENSLVRQGIDGFGIALFWQDSTTNEVKFIGKGNCNIDKSNENIFGFTSDYPRAQSWEFKNNTSNRVLFKSADFSGSDWTNDFEARYPEESTDVSDLSAVCAWVASTDRDAVSSESDKAARLQKFKDEFEQHFVKDAILFYYLFTETFLMVDNRAKNMFLTTYDGTHWFSLPYDFDTAIGINNEGALVFEYNLEDTDKVGGADVFNGQESVLWKNVRDAFGDELALMYKTLRSMNDGDASHESPFSYYRVAKLFTDHQSVWPEAMWNEDAFIKYLQPYLLNNEDYLGMLQGNKASQRDWWLFNAFRYRDSKYQCGDAEAQSIKLRCYAVGDITITPYSHIYGRVKYGSYTTSKRCTRNQSYVMECGLDQMNDTETYVYSADRIASVGDLSHLLIGQADFSAATKLQNIKLGDEAPTYENLNLGTGSNRLSVGSNDLLTSVNIANCKALGTGDQKSVDFSGCIGLKTLTAVGTKLKGVDLPNGGRLETLRLPATLTNFTIRNQKNLTNLYFEGLGSLETLFVENTPNVPLATIISAATSLNRVRLIGVEWTETSETTLADTIEKLESCIGMDATGGNTEHAVVSGRVNVPTISAELLAEINDNFPELVVVVNDVPQYIGRVVNYDNTLLYREVIAEGSNAYNPVTTGAISAPTKPNEEDTVYQFRDFGTIPTNVHNNFILVAQYDTTYRVLFMDGSNTYSTKWVLHGANCPNPGTPSKSSTAQYSYTFAGWSRTSGGSVDSTALQNITAPRTLYAVYTSTVRTYTVYFYNGTTLLQTVQNVAYGGSATYTGSTPVDPDGRDFLGWRPAPTNIQANTSCYARFKTAGVPTATTADGAYGVEWDYSNSSPALTRKGLAAAFADPVPATSRAGSGSSPFDSIMPWAGMKRYNIIDGEVSYSEDDAGFSETDYDTVVYIPKFYYTAIKDTENSKWLWAISPTEQEGFVEHPGSGRYIGRFHTSGDSSGVFTKAGSAPLVSTSRTNFRTYSHNKGSKWWMIDLATWSALQMLYLVEFANFNSQSTLGTGYSGFSAMDAGGSTGAAAYHTLKLSGAHNQYRWVEDPFSNCLDWVDGFMATRRSTYVGTANSTFADTISALTATGITLPKSDFITGLGYSETCPWAFIPDTASGGSTTTYISDRVFSATGDCALIVGGVYYSGTAYGLFCFEADNVASYTSIISSRLLYIP